MQNANSVKPKKSKLFNFFFAYNLDIVAGCESKLTPNTDPHYVVILCTVQTVTNSAMESCSQFRRLYDMTSSYCLILLTQKLSPFAYACKIIHVFYLFLVIAHPISSSFTLILRLLFYNFFPLFQSVISTINVQLGIVTMQREKVARFYLIVYLRMLQ